MNQKNNLKTLSPYSWDPTPEKDLSPEELRKHEILNDHFFNCFNSQAGQKILEYYRKKYLDSRVCFPELGQNGVYLAYKREGENQVIREILLRIEQSKNRRKNDDNRQSATGQQPPATK